MEILSALKYWVGPGWAWRESRGSRVDKMTACGFWCYIVIKKQIITVSKVEHDDINVGMLFFGTVNFGQVVTVKRHVMQSRVNLHTHDSRVKVRSCLNETWSFFRVFYGNFLIFDERKQWKEISAPMISINTIHLPRYNTCELIRLYWVQWYK